MKPKDIVVGQKVRYYPSMHGEGYIGTVANKPWQLCSGVWVVKLIDMPIDYAIATGKKRYQNVVFAASLNAIELP